MFMHVRTKRSAQRGASASASMKRSKVRSGYEVLRRSKFILIRFVQMIGFRIMKRICWWKHRMSQKNDETEDFGPVRPLRPGRRRQRRLRKKRLREWSETQVSEAVVSTTTETEIERRGSVWK